MGITRAIANSAFKILRSIMGNFLEGKDSQCGKGSAYVVGPSIVFVLDHGQMCSSPITDNYACASSGEFCLPFITGNCVCASPRAIVFTMSWSGQTFCVSRLDPGIRPLILFPVKHFEDFHSDRIGPSLRFHLEDFCLPTFLGDQCPVI